MIFEQRKYPLAEMAKLPLFEMRPRPPQRFFKAFIVEWFEQVIERVEFKRPHRILVVGRHKDDDRQLIGGELVEHPEAVEVGHLDVEENEVGRAPPDRDQCFMSIRAFADDRELAPAAQQIADAPSRQNFVINDQRAYGCHLPDSAHGLRARRRRSPSYLGSARKQSKLVLNCKTAGHTERSS